MKKRWRTILTGVMAMAGIVLLAGARVAEAGLAVSPLKQEISLRPGEAGKLTLNLVHRVHKQTAGAESATLSIMDVTVLVGGELDFKDASTQKNSASKWITMSQKEVTLEPGKALPVELTITPPPQAAPGEYYSAIIVSLAKRGKTGKGIEVQYEIASGVFVTVLGQTLPKQAKISGCVVEWPAAGAATELAGVAGAILEAPAVVVTLQNTGPARFNGTGRMRIIDLAQNRVVMTAVLTSRRPCVFGGDSRRFEAPLTKALAAGKYAIKVDMDYESTWAKAYMTETIEITAAQSALLTRIKERQDSTALAVSISPVKHVQAIMPGATRSLGVGIKSRTDVTVRCMVTAASTGETDVDSWISVGAEDFSLSPAAHKSVEIKVAVPATAKRGTYTATLAIESWPEGADVRRTEIPIEIQVQAERNLP